MFCIRERGKNVPRMACLTHPFGNVKLFHNTWLPINSKTLSCYNYFPPHPGNMKNPEMKMWWAIINNAALFHHTSGPFRK